MSAGIEGRLGTREQAAATLRANSVKPGAPSAATPKPGAPAKADAAPKTQTTFTGLCEALNSIQIELVKKGIYTYPNTYSIEFKPRKIGQSKVKLDGTVNHASTPMGKAADATNQQAQSINTNARKTSVQAGTSILQQIDKVIRNSQYILDQANVSRQEDGSTPSQVPPGQLVWYNIAMGALLKSDKFDPKRNDYAYDIKFLITTYQVPQIDSEYFPRGTFRGLHKEYDYWFTGKNTEVLAFEQELNTNWFTVIGQNAPADASKNYAASNPRDIRKRLFSPATDVNNQGAENEAMQAGASAASSLFSDKDFAEASLTIMGDPAWIVQQEIVYGANADAFEFTPFTSDGSINTGDSTVLFSINWNTIQDYNLDTGLMQVNSYNQDRNVSAGSGGTPQYSTVYNALEVVSMFQKGKFTQNLRGAKYNETYPAAAVPAKPPAKPPATVPDAPKIRPPGQTGGVGGFGTDTFDDFGRLKKSDAQLEKEAKGTGLIARQAQKQIAERKKNGTWGQNPTANVIPPADQAAASGLTPDEARNVLDNGYPADIRRYGGRAALEERARAPKTQ